MPVDEEREKLILEFDFAGNLLAEEAIVVSLKDTTARVRAEDAKRRYAERLEVLHAIDQAILAAQSPGEIARIALQHLHRLAPYQRGNITIFAAGDHEATVLAAEVESDTQVGTGMRVPVEVLGNIEDLCSGQARVPELTQIRSSQ